MAKQIQTKRCTKCKQFSDFHKNLCNKDGLQGYCIKCTKLYFQKPSIKISSQKAKRKYKKTDKGKQSIVRDNQSEKARSRKRRYNKSKKGKASMARFWEIHPMQYKARNALCSAIRSGKLPQAKNMICHFCSKQALEYHHHKGYEPENWLDVIPVCKKHHKKGF